MCNAPMGWDSKTYQNQSRHLFNLKRVSPWAVVQPMSMHQVGSTWHAIMRYFKHMDDPKWTLKIIINKNIIETKITKLRVN